MGFRNSSIRMSPGWGLGSSSVVVDDFDFVGMALSPDETDAPLIVDPDRMLPAAVASQGFEAIGRWNAQIGEALRRIEQTQPTQGGNLNVSGQTPAAAPLPDRCSLLVA